MPFFQNWVCGFWRSLLGVPPQKEKVNFVKEKKIPDTKVSIACLPVLHRVWSRRQQLHLPVDVLALGSMKTAARCDNQWELQKHETHQVVERICGLGLPMPISS